MRVRLLLVSIWLLGACGGEDSRAPAPQATGSAANPSARATPAPPSDDPPDDPPEPEAPARPAIPEADARAVLDAWLAAQNGGDFEAYSALYASRFSGIKRSEDRVRRYAHDGWLANRRSMFRHPQQVGASDVVIETSSDSARVRFTQSWSSRSYADEGPKRLLLVREGGALRIAQEEMLASTRTDGRTGTTSRAGGGEFRFMLGALPGRVELLHGSGEQTEAWATGRPRLLASEGGTVVVARRAVLGELPPEVRARIGSSYRVYGQRGKVCEGAITELSVVRRYTPHFSQVQAWNDDGLSAAQRAAAAWETGADGGVLVGQLGDASACRGGLFALPADGPELRLWESRALPEANELRGAMEQVARARHEYGATQREYQRYGGEGAWEASDGASARVLRFAAQGHGAVGVLDWQAGDGCGSFEGAMLLPFRLHGGDVEARPIVPPMLGVHAVAVFDLGDNGKPDILVRDYTGNLLLLRPDGDLYHVSVQRNVPYFDCPC